MIASFTLSGEYRAGDDSSTIIIVAFDDAIVSFRFLADPGTPGVTGTPSSGRKLNVYPPSPPPCDSLRFRCDENSAAYTRKRNGHRRQSIHARLRHTVSHTHTCMHTKTTDDVRSRVLVVRVCCRACGTETVSEVAASKAAVRRAAALAALAAAGLRPLAAAAAEPRPAASSAPSSPPAENGRTMHSSSWWCPAFQILKPTRSLQSQGCPLIRHYTW